MASTLTSAPSPAKVRRNRIYFVLGTACVLAIGGIFARATAHALYVRSITGSVFADYVIKHHIGSAVVTDDASGFQGDMCTLHLNHPIPLDELQKTAVKLAYQYYSLDGGDTLTFTYTNSTTHREITEASTYYAGGHTLMVTLNEGSSKIERQMSVDWPSNNSTGS